MSWFSYKQEYVEEIGELVLEALLSSNITSITDLNLGCNESWFAHPELEDENPETEKENADA